VVVAERKALEAMASFMSSQTEEIGKGIRWKDKESGRERGLGRRWAQPNWPVRWCESIIATITR
jgi:hypothetical protein